MAELTEVNYDSDVDEMFKDAYDDLMIVTDEVTVQSNEPMVQGVSDIRLTLPHLRPPDMKISLWSILKDSIGKDLSRISMPVYFNEPLSMLQKACEMMEYNNLLVDATKEESSMMRLGLIAAHHISGISC